MKVNGINVEMPKLTIEQGKNKKAEDKGFGNVLLDAVNDVNQSMVDANTAVENMLTGKSRNIHETMVALEKADVNLKLMTNIRNKALESYNTIMRMQS